MGSPKSSDDDMVGFEYDEAPVVLGSCDPLVTAAVSWRCWLMLVAGATAVSSSLGSANAAQATSMLLMLELLVAPTSIVESPGCLLWQFLLTDPACLVRGMPPRCERSFVGPNSLSGTWNSEQLRMSIYISSLLRDTPQRRPAIDPEYWVPHVRTRSKGLF